VTARSQGAALLCESPLRSGRLAPRFRGRTVGARPRLKRITELDGRPDLDDQRPLSKRTIPCR
jgi:hypothetical protein